MLQSAVSVGVVLLFHQYVTAQLKSGLGQLSSEKQLINDLLTTYRSVGLTGRPVRNTSQAVVVRFGLGLIRMEVDEKDNMLSTSVWTRYRWVDEYLRWDPREYGNVTDVKLSHKDIWTPDIMLYNTASTERYERMALAVVTYEGVVQWYPHRIFHISCSIDVRKFPFDNQTCHMWFGSWTHNEGEIDLHPIFDEGIDLSTFNSDYKDACKWTILQAEAKRLGGSDTGTGFAVLSFSLHLQRRMMFSSYILTFPAVFLSFLTVTVFWLPAGTSDKSSLGLTIFSSLLLLLLILVESAPPTSSGVPILGLYYCFNIIIVMMSIFLSSLVANVASGFQNRKVPKGVKMIFFNVIAPALCMKPDSCESSLSKNGDVIRDVRQCPDVEETRLLHIVSNLDMEPANRKSSSESSCPSSRPVGELCLLVKEYIHHKMKEDLQNKKRSYTESEWKFLARLLDRLFLFLYLISIVLSLVFMFPHPQ